jgi:two-component sensor histidine kinase
MRLDMRSVLFSISLIELLVAVLLGAFALSAKPHKRELFLWAEAYAMLLIGTLFIFLRGLVPDFVSIVLGNYFILGFLFFILAGIMYFRGKAPPWPLIAGAGAVIAAWMSWFTFARPDLLLRLVFYELVVVAVGSAAAFQIGRKPAPGLALASRLAAAILAAIAAVNLARLVLVLALGYPADFMESGSWDAFMLVIIGGLVAVLFIALIILHLSALNAELAASARDRALLVTEMAHRTMNDLAIVDSLISIEELSRAPLDPAGSARLGSLRERIRCLGVAHERLSRSADPGMIRLDEYLSALALGLPGHDGVSVTTDFAEATIPFAHAAPLGLAMIELAANAFQHAFPDGRGGRLSLALRVGKSSGRATAELVVRDDGVGTSWPPLAPGLGTMIVQSFASRIPAEVAYSFEGGSAFTLRFELPTAISSGR